MKILIELRPALEGHAGIPQETRLLFRGLGRLIGIEVQGLIQSSDRFIAEGLAEIPSADVTSDARIDCLSRVVVSLQPTIMHRRPTVIGRVIGRLRGVAFPAALLFRSLIGFREKLSWFEPAHFRDFIWRSMFAKSLPAEDLDQVTCAKFRIARAPYGLMHACGLVTRRIGRAVYPKLDTTGLNVMLALTPYPATVTAETKLVVRYFDAVPLLMPHTIINKAHHQALHYQSLRLNVANGAYFACCSDATRRDLLAIFPEVEGRTATIPCMVSHHYFKEESSACRVPEILVRRLSVDVHGETSEDSVPFDDVERLDYLLMVSTLEPRKNHVTLVEAWENLRARASPGLKLVLVGSLGWEHEAIVERLLPWIVKREIVLLSGVPADELRMLYRHALATVCPSFAEGFGYSGVEAMRCGGVVIASDISAHREVYQDAAEYFSPYSALDAASAIEKVIFPNTNMRRQELQNAGEIVSSRYLPEKILPLWKNFLTHIQT